MLADRDARGEVARQRRVVNRDQVLAMVDIAGKRNGCRTNPTKKMVAEFEWRIEMKSIAGNERRVVGELIPSLSLPFALLLTLSSLKSIFVGQGSSTPVAAG